MNGYERTRLLPSLACLPVLVACTDAPQWTGTVAMRDSIAIISNPAVPLLADTQGFVSELWAVQDPTWEYPSRVHAAAGLVVVVDPQASRVHVISAAGTPRASLGRAGGGPGEFLRLQDAFLAGDRLVVLDGGKRSIQYLTPDGAYLSSLRVEGWVWSGFPLAAGELLVKGDFRSDPSESTTGTWISVREGGAPAPFTPPSLDSLPEEQGVQCSDLFAWAGGAAQLRSTTPQMQILDRTGSLLWESRLALPVEVVSDAERDRALSDLRRRLAGSQFPPEYQRQSVAVMEQRWRVKCRFGPLRFDPSGSLAALREQNPETFGSGNATLHLLSRDGIYVARAVFPSAWRDFTLEDGVVYALTQDPATDLITLRAYRVDLPSSLFADAAAVLNAARQEAAGRR